MNPVISAGIAGWALAATFFGLWLGARDNLAREVERCNTSRLAAVVEAEQVVRKRMEQAQAEKARQEQTIQDRLKVALEKAETAAREAADRPVRVREIIKVDHDACLTVPMPDAVVRGLR